MESVYQYRDQLESSRLVTRFLTAADALPWSAFFMDEDSVAYLPQGNTMPPTERSENWIERQLTRYKEHRYGHQALLLKNTQEFIGQCGLIKQDVNGTEEIEVGYHIFKQFRGNGYAPEAARLFINYAFSHSITESIISIIDIRNTRSQRVAEKNGLTREKQIIWSDMDVYIFRIHKLPDFLREEIRK